MHYGKAKKLDVYRHQPWLHPSKDAFSECLAPRHDKGVKRKDASGGSLAARQILWLFHRLHCGRLRCWRDLRRTRLWPTCHNVATAIDLSVHLMLKHSAISRWLVSMLTSVLISTTWFTAIMRQRTQKVTHDIRMTSHFLHDCSTCCILCCLWFQGTIHRVFASILLSVLCQHNGNKLFIVANMNSAKYLSNSCLLNQLKWLRKLYKRRDFIYAIILGV